MRALLVHPLVWYLGLTLGVPVLNGARIDAAFAEHAASVVIVSVALLAAWRAVRPRRRPSK